VVKIYYGERKAQKSEEEFNRVFKEKKIPSRIEKVKIRKKELNILEFLVKTKQVSSKSEAKRLILQKAIRIDGILKLDWQETIRVKKGMIVKIGKRRFVQIEK
jgi:tyrosyl-tRNA synthetase